MKWKRIAGYEDYEISDTGLVRSLKRGGTRVLSPGKLRAGYLMVQLCREGKCKSMLVHRLVAEAFIPNPLGLETVNHKNELKTDNRVSNLEWMSVTDNCRYGTRDLRIALACRNRPDVSKEVIQLDQQGNVVNRFPSIHEAARRVGISDGNIHSACCGKRKTAGGYSWRYA